MLLLLCDTGRRKADHRSSSWMSGPCAQLCASGWGERLASEFPVKGLEREREKKGFQWNEAGGVSDEGTLDRASTCRRGKPFIGELDGG